MRILIIVSEMVSISGSPMYNYTLAMEMAKQKHEVDVLSIFSNNEIRRNLNEAGVRTISQIDKKIEYDMVLISQHKHKKLLDEIKARYIVNIIHSEMYEPDTPIIHKRIDKYIAIRPSIKEYLIKEYSIPEHKIVVIYNGIDFERFNPRKRKKHEGKYIKVVLPCYIAPIREKLIRYYTQKANENYRVYIYGKNCLAGFTCPEYVYINPPQFNIEDAICDADIIAGILLGRVNLEAHAMGIKSIIHNPDNAEDCYEYKIDNETFNEQHNIENTVRNIIDLIFEEEEEDNTINLFINHYDDIGERQKELEYCLNKNIENKHIKHIFLIHEKGVSIPDCDKVVSIKINNRPTITDMFNIANQFSGIKIISNSDIYFNETISKAKDIADNQVYALCRWDRDTKGNLNFFDREDSQDTWIYRGSVERLNMHEYLGTMGVDNVLAYELEQCYFNVLSPSEDIQAIHYDKKVKDYAELQKSSLNHTRKHKILKFSHIVDGKDYKILFKFPIRERKDKFFLTLDKYYRLMTGSNFEFVITLDNNDKKLNTQEVRKKLDTYKNLTYHYGDNSTKIEACNADIPQSNWDILVLVSDDMIPQQKGYDDIIRKNMSEYFPDTDGVLWYNDGSPNARNLNTLSILGREYYNRFEYIYHPDYKSFWCDLEFQNVAHEQHKQIFINKCIIRHEHPSWGYGVSDELFNSRKNDAEYDKDLYYKRQAMNYPKNQIPKIAYFIWSKGTPLSYLRYLTLVTFRKHHPDYKMILYLSKAIKEKNWEGKEEQEYYKDTSKIKDYLQKVKELDVEVREYSKYSNLNPTQIADIFRFEQLYETGGWFFDIDQLFLGSVDSLRNNDFVFGGKSIAYIGVIGAKKGSVSCKEVNNKQLEALKKPLKDYQSLGIILLHEYLKAPKEQILQTDDEVFYPIYWDNVGQLYEGKINISELKTSIALHWHGGYPASQEFNFKYTEELAQVSQDSISVYLRCQSKTAEVFNNIIDNNIWGGESKSGTGSNLVQTKEIREKLPKLIRRHGIKTMLDIPCGDYFWMRNVNLAGVDYMGADIVQKLIDENRKNYPDVKFEVMDIITTKLPKVDLIFCRDCLVHLPYSDIHKALNNCKESGSRYLLTTSFPLHNNHDIQMGDWRPLNLEQAPFNLHYCGSIVENCTENKGIYKDKTLLLFDLKKI
jgi:hypothetical protein